MEAVAEKDNTKMQTVFGPQSTTENQTEDTGLVTAALWVWNLHYTLRHRLTEIWSLSGTLLSIEGERRFTIKNV